MDVNVSEVRGLNAWLRFFAADEYPERIMPGGYRIQFFHPNDSTCMVLSQEIDKAREYEYCFAAEDEAMMPTQAQLVFNFLSKMDYSLEKLLDWLERQVWVFGIDGVQRVYVDGLLITKIGLTVGDLGKGQILPRKSWPNQQSV